MFCLCVWLNRWIMLVCVSVQVRIKKREREKERGFVIFKMEGVIYVHILLVEPRKKEKITQQT